MLSAERRNSDAEMRLRVRVPELYQEIPTRVEGVTKPAEGGMGGRKTWPVFNFRQKSVNSKRVIKFRPHFVLPILVQYHYRIDCDIFRPKKLVFTPWMFQLRTISITMTGLSPQTHLL